MTVLVFLNWPEKCFQANTGDLKYLRSLLPRGAKLVSVKSERAFLKALPQASVVITWHFRAEWYDKAKKLKWVATPAAGQELISPPPNPSSFILHSSSSMVHFGHFHGAIMSESVVAFIMAWARGFFLDQPDAWPRTWMSDKCYEVAGTTAVIWGYGNIGKIIGEKLTALGVKVEGFSRHRPLKTSTLRGLSPDWFIDVLPSTTGTGNLVNAKILSALPKKCVFINVGRGISVDEEALIAALEKGKLAGAYLDVAKHEPSGTGGDSPNKTLARMQKIASVKNLKLMPHASAFSPNYLKRCFKELKNDGVL